MKLTNCMKLCLNLSGNHSESPNVSLSCLCPGRAAAGRWLSCCFIFGFLTSEVFASHVVVHWLIVLATVPRAPIWDTMSWQFLLGLLDRLQSSVGCWTWCMFLPAQAPWGCISQREWGSPSEIGGNQKNFLELINEYILLRLEVGLCWSSYFLHLVEGLVSIMASFCPLSHSVSGLAQSRGRRCKWTHKLTNFSVPFSAITLSFYTFISENRLLAPDNILQPFSLEQSKFEVFEKSIRVV